MKILKFRAWNTKNRNWLSKDFSFGEVYNGFFWDDECTVIMQFTGLLDKNGKEIYESDYLSLNGVGESVEVTWNDDHQGWVPKVLKGDTAWEIVGNKYETKCGLTKEEIYEK